MTKGIRIAAVPRRVSRSLRREAFFAASSAAALSAVLAAWPHGLEAFAEHQEASVASLCRGDKSLDSVDGVLRPESGPTLDTEAMCGLICVLYVRPSLTQIDLDRTKISPASQG